MSGEARSQKESTAGENIYTGHKHRTHITYTNFGQSNKANDTTAILYIV